MSDLSAELDAALAALTSQHVEASAGAVEDLSHIMNQVLDLGSPEMYEVWNDVHTAALEDYGISDEDLFLPGLAP